METLLRHNPRSLLLGDIKLRQTKRYTDFMANMLTATAPLIAGSWKSEIVPSVEGWLFKIRHISLLSKRS